MRRLFAVLIGLLILPGLALAQAPTGKVTIVTSFAKRGYMAGP